MSICNLNYKSAIECITNTFGAFYFVGDFIMENILFIGGDLRSRYAFKILSDKGFSLSSYGLFEGDGYPKLSKKFDVVVLPVPTTRDGKNINCPLTDTVIPLARIRELYGNCLILSGGYAFDGLRYIDYLSRYDFSLLNAVPTAEGTIAKAIEISKKTLFDSKVLVIGYGKCGKVLADRLRAFKCDLTVSARKAEDFSMLKTLGIKPLHTAEVKENAPQFDIIFNTVDLMLFDDFESLTNTIVIDISSKGCLDFNKASVEGLKAIMLPGIPGKTSPESAGKIVANTIMTILNEENGKWKI